MSTTLPSANLLTTLNALGGLSPLFGSSSLPTFANPLALSSTAQANLALQEQFPPQQVVALSGLVSQALALNATALPLLLTLHPEANSFLVNAGSSVLPAAPYTQTAASSSNSAAVSARSTAGATLTSYQVNVSQVGVAQVNAGATGLTSATTPPAVTSGTARITINGAVANANYTINASFDNQQALTAAASAINSVTSNNDIQQVVLSNATSGTFKLSFNGSTTAAITVSSSATTTASNIQTALAAIAPAGTTVTVGTTDGRTFTVGFANASGSALDQQPLQIMTATNVSLNSGATVGTAPAAGLTAVVTSSGTSSFLTVSANGVGTANGFTLADANGGNALTLTGAGTATTTAQDAVYSVNGAGFTSTTSNTVTLDSGKLTLTLLADTTTPATVTVASNNTNLASTVTSLVNAYNNLQSFLSSNSPLLSPSIGQQAQSLVQAHAGGLAAIGITSNSDGTLSVDQTTLQGLADSNPSAIQSALSGAHGLATTLHGFTNQILTGVQQQFGAAAPVSLNNGPLASMLAQSFPDVLTADLLFAGNLLNVHA
ncbi:MAG: hypothetical protein KGJ86_07415 [Chloroflexota bacterium]|nr:hypothetical protein [Chloroflexota bacterium]